MNVEGAVKSVLNFKSLLVIALTILVVIVMTRVFTVERIVDDGTGQLEIKRSLKMPKLSME